MSEAMKATVRIDCPYCQHHSWVMTVAARHIRDEHPEMAELIIHDAIQMSLLFAKPQKETRTA